ncbi:hypothetical protein POV27_14640 [Aureisphaera galaxeae]|uniref:hypothetical protein n=1 Tax=Aureisphaera galaxeae TaxID=1538023 RepID=UPI0023506FD0|nr:hypothetical protein [Aureisphaera galaxeae]MDC8005297.1 hypothetical protein [Aureisphaera galaxeae]
MKTNAIFFLLIFSIFIIAPAVISLCDSEVNIIEFSMGEEEKADTSLADSEKHPFQTLRIPVSLNTGVQKTTPLISFELLWDTWYPDTFSPPPESIVL